jgi:hypothetical protein
MEINGSIVELPGVVVSNGRAFFIPQEALRFFK